MEIKITANNFPEAVNIAFRDYGVTPNEILDFSEDEGTFTLQVTRTIESEIKLNNEVKSIVSTNRFSCNDMAFICNDNKVHTPNGSNLFERIKNLLESDLIPLIGFNNLIDASDKLSQINESIDKGMVAYSDLVLTKEGNLLKGSNLRTISTNTRPKLSDPLFTIEIECTNPDKLLNILRKVTSDLGFSDYFSGYVDNGKLYMDPTSDWSIEILDIILTCSAKIPKSKVRIFSKEFNISSYLS